MHKCWMVLCKLALTTWQKSDWLHSALFYIKEACVSARTVEDLMEANYTI